MREKGDESNKNTEVVDGEREVVESNSKEEERRTTVVVAGKQGGRYQKGTGKTKINRIGRADVSREETEMR